MDEAQIAALISNAVKEATAPFATQFTALNTAIEGLKKPPTQVTPPVVTPPVTPPVVTPPAALPPEVNSQLAEMKRLQDESNKRIEALTKANEESDKKVLEAEKKSVINTALSGMNFSTPEARETAFEKLSGQVKRDDNGVLIAGDNLTPEVFAKTFFSEKHPYLLAPEVRGGSGVGAGGVRGGKIATMEMLKPEMTSDDRAAVVSRIQAVLAESR